MLSLDEYKKEASTVMASTSEAGAGVAAPLKLWWFWLRHVWGYLVCLLETEGQRERERESQSFPEQKNERARAGGREGGKEREALNDYKTNASKACGRLRITTDFCKRIVSLIHACSE